MIKKISKKEIPLLINSSAFWEGSFLPITKHRFYAHYNNPWCDDDDIVLLLAYDNDSLVGYMGVYIDKIELNNEQKKIGWLSTWWIDPKTKGKGIGRSLLETMYAVQNGKIGVSQFTPSAKRVYEKSNYFSPLKKNEGYKFVYRSNLSVVLPLIKNRLSNIKSTLKFIDKVPNFFISIKLQLHFLLVRRKLKDIQIEYVNYIDTELDNYISNKNTNHISKKSVDFFTWLKSYHWVQEAPLIEMVDTQKYQFSMCAEKFNIYFIKILVKNEIGGFIVLQKRDSTLKILFSYYNEARYMARILFLHIVKLRAKQLLCYDENLNSELLKIGGFLYKKKKIKESIISKTFGNYDYEKITLNLGDGDCSFA